MAVQHTLLVALAFAAGACQAARPQAPLSESAVRLDLPLVRQDALYDCGLASISALCQYWGVEIPDEERASLARTAEERSGLSGDELRGVLEQLGFEVFLFEGSLDRQVTGIFANVDAGRPLLVMLSPDGAAHHYALVLGYDEQRVNLILLDPLKGELLVPVHAFERDWERCQHFALLASRSVPAHPYEKGAETMLTHAFASTLCLAALSPAGALSPPEATALHASFDPNLGSLRAGRAEAPAALAAHERSALAVAQERSPALAALRAGSEPSDSEWKWMAIGGAIVLLIILI